VIVHDLAEEIWRGGGALRGGEINFVGGRPRLYNTDIGRDFWLFRVDDNSDGGDDFTALGVITPQRKRHLGEIITNGGLISIAVTYIESRPSKAIMDGTLRLVAGKMTMISAAREDGSLHLPEECHRIGHSPDLNACVTPSFNAAGETVHVHVLCLDDDARPVSLAEKRRRVAVYEAKNNVTLETDGTVSDVRHEGGTVDGNKRLITLLQTHPL